MSKTKSSTIAVRGTAVSILTCKDGDFISLTDMLKANDGEFFISDWLRNRNTVEFLGIWESVFNPDFNYGEFATIRSQAGLNSFILTPNQQSTINNRHSAIVIRQSLPLPPISLLFLLAIRR